MVLFDRRVFDHGHGHGRAPIVNGYALIIEANKYVKLLAACIIMGGYLETEGRRVVEGRWQF